LKLELAWAKEPESNLRVGTSIEIIVTLRSNENAVNVKLQICDSAGEQEPVERETEVSRKRCDDVDKFFMASAT